MIEIDQNLAPTDLLPDIERMWALSAVKILSIENTWRPEEGAPVYTVEGRYTSRGWTEWTQGFQFGSALLQFDATGDEQFMEIGRSRTLERMPNHLTHMGVHDHGFNNISTYGALWRLMREGRLEPNDWEQTAYETALRCSGAVQARRWTRTADGGGFIHSFNGPHSLFADTMRSLRSLAVAHLLGQELMEERDLRISLLERLLLHAEATARYTVYYGEGRDAYDVAGRTAHESIFNTVDGSYRCPGTQQGYSPFSTWTRGLAWTLLGFAEELEFIDARPEVRASVADEQKAMMLRAAMACSEFYVLNTPTDGVPYWDTGAPGLGEMEDWADRPSDPYNDHEPVDSSAAAIAAQGLLRLGRSLEGTGSRADGLQLRQAGLTVARTLLREPYLSTSGDHQGLLLHSIYHRPNGWDHVPEDRTNPCGEACMWGDYHLRELALLVQREAKGNAYYTFFGPAE